MTFDVEDFINFRSFQALDFILRLLKKYDFRALFFLTGHVTEKIVAFPEILRLLETHEVGYHSTSHSIRPNIFEYTDLKHYRDAYLISLKRETSHINPLSGLIEGEGGIKLLRDLFPQKKIEAYRAPGFSWSPPHLEALASLGIKNDFSTELSKDPVCFKGITFYPFPCLIDWKNTFSYYKDLFLCILKEKITVLDFHPDLFVNENNWDHFFPKTAPQKKLSQTRILLLKFEILLKSLKFLQRSKFIDISPEFKKSVELSITEVNIKKVLDKIFFTPITQFSYKPQYMRSHLLEFFELCSKKL